MRTKTRDTFTTIRTEGAILPPDLLARVSDGDKDLGGLDPTSYHLSGETINEAISRSWNRLLGVWTAFEDRREALSEGEPETGMTRERWLLPLFEELRYGRLRTTRAVEIEGKTYPVSHDWYGTPIHLVGFRADLDRRTPGVAGAARTSPTASSRSSSTVPRKSSGPSSPTASASASCATTSASPDRPTSSSTLRR